MEGTVLLLFATLLLITLITKFLNATPRAPQLKHSSPKCYPLVGSLFSIVANGDRITQYMSDLISASPTHTAFFPLPFGSCLIATANPSNVQHILKTRFHAYPKGSTFYSTLYDLLGDGIFNTDGESWKTQRKISSHEFNNRSLRKFIDTAIWSEIAGRLLPLLCSAAAEQRILDLQDVLQRFGFDNICKVAFGFDPGCLDPSRPPSDFVVAFDDAVRLLGKRFTTVFPIIWKMKRVLRVGSEKQLQDALAIVNGFAEKLVRERKQQQQANCMAENSDLLGRFISSSDDADEKFVKDMVISFILAGRDTTSAALTWFFWLVSRHDRVEDEILKELSAIEREVLGFEEVKEMNYLHAAICESMRLYPPVPSDSKQAAEDDILPDGTVVPKGAIVAYHPYAMGRIESLWGKDWEEFRPERWLQKDDGGAEGKWRFMAEDPYKYPVFQAGPRVCLGKEMAFIQMKSVAAAVLRRFRVVAALPDFEPVFTVDISSKMKGGFPVRVEEKNVS
ncbi:Cytochrome P450 94A2 [Nymphaea thermarum]|nr:Cytochrome P450 94A2 [Nymphaea thermarum]